ncbi:MAG: helix-turn-helix domain-containing protein, partial [Gammaproteobacteria bacterium]|nr:helix-turn-helix domain-containing protein [Gammaproteobacteria bacterium]
NCCDCSRRAYYSKIIEYSQVLEQTFSLTPRQVLENMSKNKAPEQLASYRISELDQLKALAHPLRMRIIETLAAAEPMTTKQVAEKLGEKPTRLYHHVDLLEKAGLIRLTHTRQNRGATEKYYAAIARQFRADAEVFSDDNTEGQKNALRPMIHMVFDNTVSELLRLIDTHQSSEMLEEDGLLSYVEMHLTQEQIDEVQNKLKEVINHLQELDDPDAEGEELRKYRLTLAYYPLDRFG